jgi:radical SAM protein with 4Fe4S-binding SPASM domain
MHCGSAAGKAREDELNTHEALDLVGQLKQIDCKGVAMMGGEPFTRPDWHIIAQEIRSQGMDLSIITNGFSISESTFNRIESIKPDLVTVSIDGASPAVHDRIRGRAGSFDHALNSLNRFVEMGLPTGAITTVHKLNLKDLKSIRSLVIDKGIAWQVQIATPFGRLTRKYVLSREEYYSVAMFVASSQEKYPKKRLTVAGAHDMGYFSELLPGVQVVAWNGCQAGISTLGIQSNGDLRGCLALPATYNEASIRRNTLAEIWNSDEFARYSRSVKDSDIKGECAACEHKAVCKGGCSAVSLSLGGGLHQDPYCLRLIERQIR